MGRGSENLHTHLTERILADVVLRTGMVGDTQIDWNDVQAEPVLLNLNPQIASLSKACIL